MARPKKVEEKQLAPAVPQPVPIAAPQQPQQPSLVGNNLQGRVIDVDNFIKVRNSVSASTPPQPFSTLPHAEPMTCRPPPPSTSTSTNITTYMRFEQTLASAPLCLGPQPNNRNLCLLQALANRRGPSPPCLPFYNPGTRSVPI